MQDLLFSDYKTTLNRVYEAQSRFQRMYRIYSWISKTMIILNLGSLFYSLGFPDENYGLVLSLACFSLNSTFDFNKEKRIVERLVRMYVNHIVPEMNKLNTELITVIARHEEEDEESDDELATGEIYVEYKANIDDLVRSSYVRYMGEEFVAPSLDCVGIIICAIINTILFVIVPVLHWYRGTS